MLWCCGIRSDVRWYANESLVIRLIALTNVKALEAINGHPSAVVTFAVL